MPSYNANRYKQALRDIDDPQTYMCAPSPYSIGMSVIAMNVNSCGSPPLSPCCCYPGSCFTLTCFVNCGQPFNNCYIYSCGASSMIWPSFCGTPPTWGQGYCTLPETTCWKPLVCMVGCTAAQIIKVN